VLPRNGRPRSAAPTVETINLNPKTRLLFILFSAGFLGVLSFLLVDLAALVALVPAGSDVPMSMPALKLLSLVQPTVLVFIAVLIGLVLAPKVGLSAPVAESLATGGPTGAALRPQLLPGVVGALIGAGSVLLTAAVLKPFLTANTTERISKFQDLVPIPTRLLYGGITEEVLMRWGLMTLLVWIVWRVFQKRFSKPTNLCFVVAILVSSFIFGLGHLPVALFLLPEITAAIIFFVIVANSAFGVVAGYLYWKWGLESAIVAHMLGHVVLALASYVGAYF
jgi:hypothetical protein